MTIIDKVANHFSNFFRAYNGCSWRRIFILFHLPNQFTYWTGGLKTLHSKKNRPAYIENLALLRSSFRKLLDTEEKGCRLSPWLDGFKSGVKTTQGTIPVVFWIVDISLDFKKYICTIVRDFIKIEYNSLFILSVK